MYRKKLVLSIAPLLVLCALIALMHAYAPGPGVEAGSVVRLHIIANSDSAEDQRVKLLVRDALLSCEKQSMQAVSYADSAERTLMQDASAMLSKANAVLRENGCAYGARLAIGDYDFPDREYAGKVYPAGEYRALRVVLGEGEGKNWWCVMFPPLCILELDAGEIDSEEMDEIRFKSYILELLEHEDNGGGKLWERLKEYLR